MKEILLIIVLLQFSMADAVADAVADVSLYSGEVVVRSQSEADRNEALPDALIQVLQKLSGQREIPSSPSLDESLNNTDRLLRSFRYRYFDRTGPDGEVTRELRLVAGFMQAEVDKIAMQTGLPRWQQERPAVQIWVVIDDGNKRVLKPIEYGYAWDAMEDVAAMRGLPVSWPEFDEEEIQLIDMRLVWGGFTDYLVERGAPADGIAIIAVRREGPAWTLRWNLSIGDQQWSWRNNDLELMFALAQGIHQMTDNVSSVNTIAASEQGLSTIGLSIGELNSAADYAECLAYLQNLSIVTRVDIVGAEPGRVNFQLQINAALEYLTEAFKRGAVLLPASNASDYDYEYLER